MADGRYCKVYHVLAAEYPRVFEDDRTLGCYVRLLMLADAAWPLRPYLPARIDRRALAILTAEGLVMLQDTGRYSILGLDKERAVRRQNASAAAKARYADGSADRSAPGNAIRNAETLPTRSRAEAEAEGIRGAKPLDARDPSDLSTRRER